jgi:hypothetical protein
VVFPGLGEKALSVAWTYQGLPVVPAAPIGLSELNKKLGFDVAHPINHSENLIQAMKENPKAYEDAAIPVENINCPLMLVSGGDDKTWPPWLFAQQIKKRLDKHDSKIKCLAANYPKAGHQIGVPFIPVDPAVYGYQMNGKWYTMGGTAQEDDLASCDSWKKIIDFFKDNLLSLSTP